MMADVSPGRLGRSCADVLQGPRYRHGCSSARNGGDDWTDLSHVGGVEEFGVGEWAEYGIFGLSSPAGVRVLAYRYAIFWRSGTFGGRRG